MIRLETDRLVIRDHIPEDLLPMHGLLSDTAAMYYMDGIRTEALEDSRRNLETALAENDRANRELFFFAITDRATGGYIGEIGYTVKLRTPLGLVVGLGYFIRPEYWRRGITTEAARAVLGYAFGKGGVIKVESGCLKENGASEAVMKKIGMVKEADFRLHAWHDGRLKDRVEYGILRDDWRN